VQSAPHRVEVAAERVDRWLAGFAERHGATTWQEDAGELLVTAADGSTARCDPPFPPLSVDPDRPYGGIAEHAGRRRRVGVLLVRLGGYAVGVFDGTDLVVSKVGSRLVHGRSAAGGQSQKRFARRREGQARVALQAAADVAARVLVPHTTALEALVLGGDRKATAAVLDDPRLGGLRRLEVARHLDVADPRLAVLRATPARFRAVRIVVVETERESPDP
jgi:hypothetical protein